MSTLVFKESEIIDLCKVDAEIINKALSINRELGIVSIKDTIDSYKNLLRLKKGTIFFAMDMDYRTYIVNLLKIASETANAEHKDLIFSEIVF